MLPLCSLLSTHIPSSVALSSVCKILLPIRQMLCLVAQMCVWLHQQQTGQFESVLYSECTVSEDWEQASLYLWRETAAVNTLFSRNSVQLKAPRHQLPLQPQQLLLSSVSRQLFCQAQPQNCSIGLTSA